MKIILHLGNSWKNVDGIYENTVIDEETGKTVKRYWIET